MSPFAMLLGGFLGSTHCIGMCGGFALAIGSLRPRLAQTLPLQFVYTMGRIATYAFIGALAGAGGARLATLFPLQSAQRALALAAGLIMLLAGISALGWLRFSGIQAAFGTLLAPFYRHFVVPRGPRGALLAGVFTGFLPCGLVYAFAALALASGDALRGMIGMACFGLGTAPVMIAVGCGATWLTASVRRYAYRIAACFVIFLGAATVWRALPASASCAHSDASHAVTAGDTGPSPACHPG